MSNDDDARKRPLEIEIRRLDLVNAVYGEWAASIAGGKPPATKTVAACKGDKPGERFCEIHFLPALRMYRVRHLASKGDGAASMLIPESWASAIPVSTPSGERIEALHLAARKAKADAARAEAERLEAAAQPPGSDDTQARK